MGFKPRIVTRTEIDSWVEKIGDKKPSVIVAVIRAWSPGIGDNKKGTVGSYDHLPTTEEVKRDHGPGKYRLRVSTRQSEGRSYAYAANVTVTIK